jgi:hypothetical protein
MELHFELSKGKTESNWRNEERGGGRGELREGENTSLPEREGRG